MSVPVTEQFLTAERTLAIEGKSIATMAVVGSDLVLTRENASALSVALPSGGSGAGPVGISRLSAATVTQDPSFDSSYMTAYFDEWTVDVISGESLGISSPAGSQGWAYAEAGWYQTRVNLWMGFNAGVEPLPDAVVLSANTWEGVQTYHEVPLSAPVGGTWSNRSLYGAVVTIMLPAYYSPGIDVATAADGANHIALKWQGDAELDNANGAGASSNSVTMQITRLA